MNGAQITKSRRSKRLVGILVLLAFAGLAWFFRADLLCAWGSAKLESDPVRAGELLQQSIEAADGDFPEAQLLLCRALGKQRRWLESLGYFSQIKSAATAQAQLLNLGVEAADAKQYALAEMALTAGVVSGKHEVDILRALIPLQWTLRRLDGVLKHCQRLIELAPRDPLPHEYSGRIYESRQQAKSAAQAFRRALDRGPQDPVSLRRHLIGMLLELGDAKAARTQVEQLLKQTERAVDAQIYLAFILRLEGKSDAALATLDSLDESYPMPPQATQLRGVLRLDRGEYDLAVADLSAVVERQPANRDAQYKLAEAYRKSGQAELARKHLAISSQLTDLLEEASRLEGVAAVEPHNTDIRREIARLYDRLNDAQRATHWRREAEAAKRRARLQTTRQ